MSTVRMEQVEGRVSAREAAEEILRRRRGRANLIDFGRYVKRDYEPTWYQEELCRNIELVEAGEIKRLMVMMPPRHGKTLHTSIHGPTWILGRNPEAKIVQAGYSDDIAMKTSRLARAVYISDEHGRLFPNRQKVTQTTKYVRGKLYVHMPRHSVHEWETGFGGSYYACGVGAGLTGRGFNGGIIDDPHKNREEAESLVIREKIWDWYVSTFYTRREKGAWIIVIMHHWHPDDLMGRLLNEMETGTGDQWVILRYPATSDEYEALWPERYSREELDRTHGVIGDREWQALYQQEPTVRGGNLFKVAGNVQRHQSIDDFPDVQYVRFWDLASSEKQRAKSDPDYTVGPVVGIHRTKLGLPEVWIPGLVRGQWEKPERDRVILACHAWDGPGVPWGVEAIGGYKDAATDLKRLLWGFRTVYDVYPSQDKVTRAAPLEPIFEAGNVHVLDGPWVNDFITEFTGFPKGAKHDDIVDGVSGAYEMLVRRNVPRQVIGRFDAYAKFAGGSLPRLDDMGGGY